MVKENKVVVLENVGGVDEDNHKQEPNN